MIRTAFGTPPLAADLKRSAADFRVCEQLDLEFSGAGEHLFLHVRKTGRNTEEVASALGAAFGVSDVDIGFAGQKDRQAITDQWFSLRTPEGSERFPESADLQLLGSQRHARKLKRGAHRANRFEIVLRDVRPAHRALEPGRAAHLPASSPPVDDALVDTVDARLRQIQRQGFPNLFGPQRFGRSGNNVEQARRWLSDAARSGRRGRRLTRAKRSLYLSAARSHLFNLVCQSRIDDGSWISPIRGEPVVLAGSRSFFVPTDAEQNQVARRCVDGDLHPSGPLWGRGATSAEHECAALEAAVLNAEVDLCRGLENAGLDQQRRALRASVQTLQWQWRDESSTLWLAFELDKGVFATSLLRELMVSVAPEAGD